MAVFFTTLLRYFFYTLFYPLFIFIYYLLLLAPCVVPSVSQGTVIPLEVEFESNNVSSTTGYALSSKVRHGTSLEVLCNENYEFPLSSHIPPTCFNGTWSIIPKCVPAKCKTMPKTPKFGKFQSVITQNKFRK